MGLKLMPTKQQLVTVVVSMLVIAIVLRVLPIPDTYKSYFRI